jgi:hypothetical protein
MGNWAGSGPLVNAVSMAATITSDTILLRGVEGLGLHFTAPSATHVGTLAVQISNDGMNWNAVTLSTGATTIAVSSGAAVNEFVTVSSDVVKSANYLRVVYTATSGAGALTVTPAGQGL